MFLPSFILEKRLDDRLYFLIRFVWVIPISLIVWKNGSYETDSVLIRFLISSYLPKTSLVYSSLLSYYLSKKFKSNTITPTECMYYLLC